MSIKIEHDALPDLAVYPQAGFVARWYALTLDIAFFIPLDSLVHMPFRRVVERIGADGQFTRYAVLIGLLTALPLLVYFIAPTALTGRTLGKKIVGLRVVTADAERVLPLASVIFRETIGKLLSLALLGWGFLRLAFGRRAQTLHDQLAKTRVINYRGG